MFTYNCNQNIYGEIQVEDTMVANYSISKDDVNPPTVSLTINDKAKWGENEAQCMEDLNAIVQRAIS